MARPTTKNDLQLAAKKNYAALQQLLDQMTADEQNATFQFEDRDKNLRDVLIHLYEWHRLLLKWVAANQQGDPQPFLPAPYNWRTYGEMNVAFWQAHQQTSLAEAKELVEKSHQQVMTLMESLSNEELFEKNAFDWTGNSTLGSYFVSSTASHYDWAMKKIKKNLRLVRGVKRL